MHTDLAGAVAAAEALLFVFTFPYLYLYPRLGTFYMRPQGRSTSSQDRAFIKRCASSVWAHAR